MSVTSQRFEWLKGEENNKQYISLCTNTMKVGKAIECDNTIRPFRLQERGQDDQNRLQVRIYLACMCKCAHTNMYYIHVHVATHTHTHGQTLYRYISLLNG